MPGRNKHTFTKDGPRPKGTRGGARPGSGAKPKEINELHKQLFTPELAEEAVERLQVLVRQNDLDAIKYVCDRTFGKPKESVAINMTGAMALSMCESIADAARATREAAGRT
jgi:hypothetical protein